MKFYQVLITAMFLACSAVAFSQEDLMQEQPQAEESPGIEQMNGTGQDQFQEPAEMPMEQPLEESDGMMPTEEALPQEEVEEQMPQEAAPMEEDAEQQDWGKDWGKNGEEEERAKEWDKDKEHDKDRYRDRKKKWDKDWGDWDDGPRIDFGISIGFTEEAYYLPPLTRVAVFDPVLEVEPGVAVFVEKIKVVEPECLFPEDGFYTILAPTDEAFKKIAADVESQSELCEILDQYVVPELIILDDIQDQATFTALAGNEIVITRKGNDFFIGDVRIVKPLANKDKGVIVHVIDGTLE